MKITIQQAAKLTGHAGSIYSLLVRNDDQSFLSTGGDGWITEWKLDEPALGRLIAKVDQQVFTLANSPTKLFVGTLQGVVYMIDPSNPEPKGISINSSGVYSIRTTGGFLYATGADGVLSKISLPEFKLVEQIRLSNERLRPILISEDQKHLYTGSGDGSIYVIGLEDFHLREKIKTPHEKTIFSIAEMGDQLISGGRDAQLYFYDKKTFNLNKTIPAHLNTINSIAVHPINPIFATASRDKTIKVWNSNGVLLKVIDTMKGGHLGSVNALSWINKGKDLITAGDDKTIIHWNVIFN